MEKQIFQVQPIGIVYTPHKDRAQTPIQPVFSGGIQGRIEIYPEYREGLKDLEGFSHIYLLYYFDRSTEVRMQVVPYLDSVKRGVFATRAPHRPNKIGLSLVRLIRIQDHILYIEDVDMLNKTPILDIKPYIQRYDSRKKTYSGWQEGIPDDVVKTLGSRKKNQRDQ